MASIIEISQVHRSGETDLPEHIHALKDQLVNIILIIFVFLGIPGLVPSLIRSIDVGFQPPMLIDIFSFFIPLTAVLWHRRISYKIRAIALLSSMFGLAFSGLITWGLIGMGIILLMACTVLSTLLFSNWTGWSMLIVCTIAIALVSLSIRKGWVEFLIDFSSYTKESSTWAFAINMFVMLTGMLTYFVSAINTTLIKAYNSLEGRTAELRHYVHHLETLREIEKGIQVAHSPEAIAQIAVARLRQIVPGQWIGITLFDFSLNEIYLLAVGTNLKTKISQGSRFSLDEFNEVIEDFRQGKPYVILKTGKLGMFGKLLIEEGVPDSAACFPLHLHDNLIGSLNIFLNKFENDFLIHSNMLRQVADQIAIAIQQARLDKQIQHYAEELEQQVANRTRELSILYEFSSAVNDALDKQSFIESALQITINAFEFSGGCIQILSGNRQGFAIAASCGLSEKIKTVFNTRIDDNSLSSQIFSDNECVIMTDLQHDPRCPALLRSTRFKTFIGVPILIDGTCIGILNLLHDKAHILSKEEIKMISSITDQIAFGIKTTLLRQEVRKAAIVAERGRVARDIHDSITQQLYSLVLFSFAAKSCLEGQDMESLQRVLDEIKETSQQVLQEMRLMIFELLPSILEQTDLVEAVQHRLEIVEQRSGIKVNFAVTENLKISTELEEAAYFIILEALNNVLKHARATQISVHIEKRDKELEINVSDNGCGFEFQNVGSGIGLTSMKGRANDLNGIFNIISMPGKGTTIRVILPSQVDHLEDKNPKGC